MMLYKTLILLGLSTLLGACYGAKVQPEHRPVEPAKLSALISQADKIVVSESIMTDAKVLFSSTDSKDIAEFSDAVDVVIPDNWFHCMCIGTPAVRLYRGNTELAVVTSHHGKSVRCSLWTSDAMIKDPEKWLRWFDARGMPEPRKEVDEMAADAKKSRIAYERWQAAMPKSIRSVWTEATRQEALVDVKPFRAALMEEIPNTRQRVLALLTWYGSGDGPWSGFPSYEDAAEELLLDFTTSDLIAAVQDESLTEEQLEGAARLFAGWSFSRHRPDDRKALPASLKKKLLDHSLTSTNDDNIERAKNAFSQ